jgi:hypothetical protein
VPGAVPPHLVSPPAGMECRLAPSDGSETHISAVSVQALQGMFLRFAQA